MGKNVRIRKAVGLGNNLGGSMEIKLNQETVNALLEIINKKITDPELYTLPKTLDEAHSLIALKKALLHVIVEE